MTALVTDESYFWQRSTVSFGPWVEGDTALESPEPRRRLLGLVRRSGLIDHLDVVAPVAATVDDLCLVHDADYVARIRQLSEADGGEAGEYASFGPGTYPIALLSAGGAMTAVREVMNGLHPNAYALIRPPGHHAERDRGRGYCIFANIPVALRAAQRDGLLGRAAVIDIDVHHGNGTEQAFWSDPSVLAISLHQHLSYPEDSGYAGDTGYAAGRGTTVNVPLMPGAGIGAYRVAWERVVEPALRAFAPDLIVMAAGYDAGGLDPLGRMLLSSSAYGELTTRAMSLAADLCGERLVVVQEGGYSPLHVPFCGLRVLEVMSGVSTPVEDPFDWLDDLPGQEVSAEQRNWIDSVRGEVLAGGVRLASG